MCVMSLQAFFMPDRKTYNLKIRNKDINEDRKND